jgi:hypothetical protein
MVELIEATPVSNNFEKLIFFRGYLTEEFLHPEKEKELGEEIQRLIREKLLADF